MSYSTATAMQDSRVELNAKSTNANIGHTSESPQPKQTLEHLCSQLHRRVTAFLEEKTEVDVLKKVQAQTQKSLEVAQDALARYS